MLSGAGAFADIGGIRNILFLRIFLQNVDKANYSKVCNKILTISDMFYKAFLFFVNN